MMRTFNASFNAPGLSAGNGRISIRLKGAVAGRLHPATVSLNGQVLGSVTVSGLESVAATFECDNLQSVGNTLTVMADGPAGGVLMVDFFALKYRRNYRAVQDELTFNAAGHAALTLSGFSGPDIQVYDVSDPAAPVVLDGFVPETEGSGYTVSFAPAESASRYVAVCGGTNIPVNVSPLAAPVLRNVANSADYLVITTDSLMDAARSFVAYRETHGLSGMAISVGAIYDEFNCGIADPRAIRSFLGYAYRMWAKAPRYVLLLGKGSMDYRNYGGWGDCMVPSLLAGTGHGLQASDTLLADFDADGMPEMAVGRVPAGTAAEAGNGLAKVRAYEAGGDWKQRALLVADNTDKGGDFTADTAATALRMTGMEVDSTSLATQSLAQVQSQLRAALGAGRGLLCYYGHASFSQLAEEGILTAGDVSGLGNASTPPLFAAMTCLAGSFGTPGATSLGATLVTSSNGAAAVLGAGTLVYQNESRQLADAFVDSLYGRGVARVGDALLEADAMVAGEGVGNLGVAYNLLGDPALAVGGVDASRVGPLVPSDAATYDEWLKWAIPPVISDRGAGLGVGDDPDGDGVANALEWEAGTDPLSASDLLKILDVRAERDRLVIKWRSAPRRIYVLEGATSPEGPYETVSDDVPATPSENEQSVGSATGGGSGFYRVRVRP